MRSSSTVPRDHYTLEHHDGASLITLVSPDGTNRLRRVCVLALTELLAQLAREPRPLVITGNQRFFSAGADLNEIAALTGPDAFAFARMGQELVGAIARFPAPVVAAISGYCMGGGLDLALACHSRLAEPGAIFGHRGAALGLMTGWGGTQRLPRLVGRTCALEMLLTAEKVSAAEALRIGLIDAVADPAVPAALLRAASLRPSSR